MEAIKAFVLERQNCVIPPVLLCARGAWDFVPATAKASYGKLVARDLAAIIDGQHRLGGLWRAALDPEKGQAVKSRLIPFMAIDNMSVEQERQEFVDINDNQKGVKKSLLVYLGRDENFSGQAAYALMEDEESVFKGRIHIERRNDDILVLFGAISECVNLTFSRTLGSVKHFDPTREDAIRELAIQHLLMYWKAVKTAFPAQWQDMEKLPPVGQARSAAHQGARAFEWRLLEETGIRAFSRLGSDLFSLNWAAGIQTPSWDSVADLLEKLSKREKVKRVLTKIRLDPSIPTDIDPDLRSTGKAGVEAMYRHLHAELMEVFGQVTH